MSNYATKTDLKNAARIDASSFAKKVPLASLKSDIDKLDIDTLKYLPANLINLKSKVDKLNVNKFRPAPVNLSKLSDVQKMMLLKKIYIRC